MLVVSVPESIMDFRIPYKRGQGSLWIHEAPENRPMCNIKELILNLYASSLLSG